MENQILNMTHEELLIASKEVRLKWREAKKNKAYDDVKVLVEKGYKHIQFYYGCIKVKKNQHGIFFSHKNGKGTGLDIVQSNDLKYITDSVCDCGNSTIQSYK